MAHLRCDFVADSLGLATSMTVLLPQRSGTRIGVDGGVAAPDDGDGPPPVLYLLHGLSDDDTAWTRNTAIERYAEQLGAAASLSGALDVAAPAAGPGREEEDPRMWARIFDGADVAGGAADPFALLARADPSTAPPLYLCRGTGDPLLEHSVRFAGKASAAGLSVTSSFSPGEHEWGYWDARIRHVLDRLPLTE